VRRFAVLDQAPLALHLFLLDSRQRPLRGDFGDEGLKVFAREREELVASEGDGCVPNRVIRVRGIAVTTTLLWLVRLFGLLPAFLFINSAKSKKEEEQEEQEDGSDRNFVPFRPYSRPAELESVSHSRTGSAASILATIN
jgi:hypothetical protein